MSPFDLIPLFATVMPLLMVGVFVFVVVTVIRPQRARPAHPLVAGQAVSLHALFLADCRPGSLFSLDEMRAPSGRITLTADELIWEPHEGSVGPWRVPLHSVRVVERPPFATGRLILWVDGRHLGLVLDPKKRPNRFMRNDIADRRQARTGAWFADLIDAAHRNAGR